MLQFCIENIDSIIFYKISKETMTVTRRQLKERFETGKTVQGTWSCPHYKPISENEITFKRTSEHEFNDRFISVKGVAASNIIDMPNINDFIVCRYDNFGGLVWWTR